MSVPARVLNELFVNKLGSEENRKVAEVHAGSFIRDRLREASFARKVLPPEQLKSTDCQVSVSHDTLVKIEFIEPKSRAMTASFRGQPSARFIRAPKVEMAFFTIMTEMFQKTEQELQAYTMPLTKILEENSVKDIQEVEDREFIVNIESAVQALQKEKNSGSVTSLTASALRGATPPVEFSVRKGELARNADTDNYVVHPIQRPDFVDLFNMLDGNRLTSDQVLLTEVDANMVLKWTNEDQGAKVQSETAIDGFVYNKFLGRKFIKTVKTDILRPGNIYVFTKPEFLGKFYILNATKFYIDKIANLISFQAWEDVSMLIANIASVRKLETYSGDATTNVADTVRSSVIPLDEDGLGAENNRADAGLKFPNVTSF